MAGRPEMRARLNAALEIDPARTAVLAIDTHRGHLDPEVATMPLDAGTARQVIDSSVRLLEVTRAAGIPTIFVLLENRVIGGESEAMRNPFWRTIESLRERLTPELPSTVKGHNIAGSVQTELIGELGPGEGDIILRSKHRLSCFFETDLLLLIGINTNTCVQCAAFEAFNRDLGVIVVSDCVNSMYGEDLHEFGLENVARCFGWVLSVDEVAEKLGAGAASVAPSAAEPARAG